MGGRGAMVAVIGLAGLLLAVALASGWSGAARLTGRGDEADAVEEAARRFVETYGGFDFRDPDGYRRRLVEMTTGELGAALVGAAVDPVAIGQQRSTSTEVETVSVTALADGRATATVRAEQQRRWVDLSAGAGRAASTGRLVEETVQQRLVLRLAKDGDGWRVAELRLAGEQPVRTGEGPRP